MRNRLASLLIVAGTALLLFVGVSWLRGHRDAGPGPAPLPEGVVGLPLSRVTTGADAVEELARMHGQDFPLTSGAVGVYGSGGQAILWVSGAPSASMADRMVADMRARIAEGRSPFAPVGERPAGARTIHELEGLEQRHFYFRSQNLVIWMAVDARLAEDALLEILAFYP